MSIRLALLCVAACATTSPDDVTDALLEVRGPIGWDTYRQLDRLPYLALGVQSHEVSGFDRDNGNEDGFAGTYSCLRLDGTGCLLAEDRGAGEITSIWFTHADAGDVRAIGRITIELDDTIVLDAPVQDVVDGHRGAPFAYPMVANALQSSGGVYIKVPMPYRDHMRVSVQHNPAFYHVVYRRFPDRTGVATFRPDDHAQDVIDNIHAAGTHDPKPPHAGATTTDTTVTLAAGQSATVAQLTGPGAISELALQLPQLAGVRVRITFDGQTTVDAPAAELFGAGLGPSTVRALMFAAQGTTYTTWWPMPYRAAAKVELVNGSQAAIAGIHARVTSAPDPQWTAALAPDGAAGYFTAIAHAADTVRGEDWRFADVTGRGKLVGVSHVMRGTGAGNTRGYLEGDERAYVDGSLAPQWHGTGTEDFYEAGWYFTHGTFSAPFVGNTGHQVATASCPVECDATYRLMLADAIPYGAALRFGIEHGPNDDAPARYSSTAFLYTQPTLALHRTDAVDPGDKINRAAHHYSDSTAGDAELTASYEGETHKHPIPGTIRTTSGLIAFRLQIDPANQGVILRRTADQAAGFQAANVAVDGVAIGTWAEPRANPFARWIVDEFALPPSATAGKSQLAITILPAAGGPAWTAARYTADALVAGNTDTTPPPAPSDVRIVNGRRHAIWLSWAEPLDDSPIAGYRIYAATTPGVPIDDTHLAGTSRTTGFEHGPLRASTTWYYRVVAVDAGGNAGAPSDELAATTVARRGSVDGDARADILTFRRGALRDVYVAHSAGTSFGPGVLANNFFAIDNEVPLVGDFDGDGKADIATFTRGTTGDVYVGLATAAGFSLGVKWHDFFCIAGEIPAVGDFNGDGLDDIATFTRGATGDVWVALSNGHGFGPGIKWNDTFAFGGETPAIGDFDGDGRDDIVTFTQGTGADVFVGLSDGSRFVGGDYGVPNKWHDFFAPAGEVPGAGDFDGDGRDDIVTFLRGTSGGVFVARSTGNGFGAGIRVLDGFATGDAIPGIGDFDGDGRDDLVAYTRGTTADVLVALATGAGFGAAARWHDFFAAGVEWPQPSLLRP